MDIIKKHSSYAKSRNQKQKRRGRSASAPDLKKFMGAFEKANSEYNKKMFKNFTRF